MQDVIFIAILTAFLTVNWFLTPPIHTGTISDGQNVLVLVVFLVVAGVVSGLVTAATRRAIEAARARSDQTGQAFRSRVPQLRQLPAAHLVRRWTHTRRCTVTRLRARPSSVA
jgi:K+-sensing histidine kinase KdpD